LQAFTNAIRRTFVQHFTRFKLTVYSRGPSVLAELVVQCIRLFESTAWQHRIRCR